MNPRRWTNQILIKHREIRGVCNEQLYSSKFRSCSSETEKVRWKIRDEMAGRSRDLRDLTNHKVIPMMTMIDFAVNLIFIFLPRDGSKLLETSKDPSLFLWKFSNPDRRKNNFINSIDYKSGFKSCR